MSPALLAALLLLGAEPPPPEARQLKEAGDRQRAGGDAEGARESYRAAVAASGGYAEAREALGEMLLAEKRFHEAAREFELAAGIEPDLAVAWYNLGYAARRAGDLGRARDAWRRYLALRPEDLDARLGLAESARGLGELEAALQAYEIFVGLAQPLPEEAGRVEKAREAMAALRAEAAAGPPAAGLLATSVEAAPPTSTATPNPISTPTAIAASAAIATPAATATPAANPTPTPAPTTALAPAPDPSAPPPAVVVVPLPALPVQAPAPAAPQSGRQAAALQKLRLGDRLLAEGDTRLALFAYQDAVNQDPGNAEARLKLGRVYLRLEHLPEALEQFSVAAALDPADAQVRRALEEVRARLEGRAPPPGSPIIVRLPAGASLDPEAPPPEAQPPGPPQATPPAPGSPPTRSP